MSNFVKYLSILFISISILSCQFSEKITLNDDGGGTYSLSIDMSAMMQAMQKMDDSIKTKNPKITDTIINFNDFLIENKDSIAKLPEKEREKLKSLEDLKIHFIQDETKGILTMDFNIDFKNISELKNLQEKFSKGSSINDHKNKESLTTPPTDVRYSFDGKIFERKVVENKLSEEQKEAYQKSLQQSASYMEQMSYNLEYHFPKPIKSCSYKNVKFSADKKTLYINSGLKDITDNPKLLSFTVILK